jgi:hypothetical protein
MTTTRPMTMPAAMMTMMMTRAAAAADRWV